MKGCGEKLIKLLLVKSSLINQNIFPKRLVVWEKKNFPKD